MSLRWKSASSPTSAWTLNSPSANRSSLWSRIETISSEPSGSQPSPDGWPGTRTTSVSSPSGVTVYTACR
jgi:hypothetical protein